MRYLARTPITVSSATTIPITLSPAIRPLATGTTANPDTRAVAEIAPAAGAGAAAPVAPGASEPKPATPTATPASTLAPVPAKPENPLEMLKINSLWKFGGTESALQDATANCVAALGEAHRPVMGKQQLMTRGLVKCLKEKGWYGVANR